MGSRRRVRHLSWFERIRESLRGLVFGLVLFLGSFPLLWMNEGCAVDDYEAWDHMAEAAIQVDSARVRPENEGRLVRTSGVAKSTEVLRDGDFDVEARAIRLTRRVEMYQWEELTRRSSEKHLGGGETRVERYDYRRTWSERHLPSGGYADPTGHENPSSMPFQSRTLDAEEVQLGEFKLSPKLVRDIDNFDRVILRSTPSVEAYEVHLHDGGLYLGANPSTPQIGDLRIRFEQANSQEVTVTARQQGSSFGSYALPRGRQVERLDPGMLTAKQVEHQADRETMARTWGLRVCGFAAMFLGLLLLIRPFAVVADFVPFVGAMFSGITGVVGFFLTFAVSCSVIAAAWIAHRPLVAGILLTVAITSLLLSLKLKHSEIHR